MFSLFLFLFYFIINVGFSSSILCNYSYSFDPNTAGNHTCASDVDSCPSINAVLELDNPINILATDCSDTLSNIINSYLKQYNFTDDLNFSCNTRKEVLLSSASTTLSYTISHASEDCDNASNGTPPTMIMIFATFIISIFLTI